MKKLLAALCVVAGLGLRAEAGSDAVFINSAGLAYNTTSMINLDDFQGVSLQVVYTSMTAAGQNFNDGRQSTMTVTIGSNTGISSATASVQINVLSNSNVGGIIMTVGGATLTEGLNWTKDVNSSSQTACNLAAAISANTVFVSSCNFGTSSGVLFTTAPTYGSTYNDMTILSSTPAYISSGIFSGGRNNAVLTIGTATFTAQSDFVVGASSAVTATNLMNSINTKLAGIVLSSSTFSASASAGIVFTTSVLNGTAYNYAITSSTQAALTIAPFTSSSAVTGATGNMVSGADSAYLINTTTISLPSHGYTTGLPVIYSTLTVVQIGGLLGSTTYFVIPYGANAIGLASTRANAVTGTAITLTTVSTGTTTNRFNVTPSTVSGTGSFKMDVSNDGVFWNNFTTTLYNIATLPASYTLSPYVLGSTSTAWDLGPVNYRQMRMTYTAPTFGAVAVKLSAHGKGGR